MKTILLADDDESVRKMVARVLETAGYTALVAGSANEAVSQCRAGKPDLVLLDDEQGWQPLELIARLDPFVPVIVMTARASQSGQAPRTRIDSRLEKPFDPPRLLEIIQDLLEASEKERTLQVNADCSMPASVVNA